MSLYDKASIALIPSGTKASKLYSVLPANGDGDFNATRGSTATRINKDGLIETVATNVPRLDYPVTSGIVGDCPHLLLEPSSTNKFPYSNQKVSGGLETFGAGTNSITVTNNYATSPDGSLNAMRMVATCGSTSSDRAGLRDTITMSAASATLSFHAKSNTSLTQTVAIHYNGTNKQTITLTTEWQRFTYSLTSNTANNAGVEIRGGSTDTSVDVLLFGFQLEQLEYATSYIATENNASGVTRSADVCNGSGTSADINSEEGVLFVEFAALDNDLSERRFGISNSTTGNIVRIGFTSVSNRILGVIYNGGNQAVLTTQSYTITDFHKVALKYKQNDFALWVDGTEVATDSSGTTFAADLLSELAFDNGGGGNLFFGKVKQTLVFNEALSDSELATLTS